MSKVINVLGKRGLTLLLVVIMSFSLIIPATFADEGTDGIDENEIVVDADTETMETENDISVNIDNIEVRNEDNINTDADIDIDVDSTDETIIDENNDDSEDEYGVETYSSGINENQSYVSGISIQSQKDGVAPWDDDDEPGNDSNDSNNIVRTYDYINYMLSYTTALMDPSHVVDEAYLMVEFELDCSPIMAEFDVESLNWCENLVVTYYYDDGTSNTTYNSSKTVEKQILTGQRHLSVNESGQNAIPGTGTLSVEIYVKTAVNGDTIQPKFTLWMEGNDESLQKSINSAVVTISAAQKYNVEIKSSGGTNVLGYYDFDNGTISTSFSTNSIYGRMMGYSVTLQLYNDYVSKGLKGIELPQGDIEFDITLNSEVNGVDYTNSDDFGVYLWDYCANNTLGSDRKGTLGRSMVSGSSQQYAWYGPGNKGSGEAYCYNGGTWSLSSTNVSNIYHVTVSGYEFDYETLHFPQRYLWSNSGEIKYDANVNCFSSMFIEVFSQFPEEVTTTSTVYQQIAESNLTVDSTPVTDVYSTDDIVRTEITVYPRGSFSQYQRYTAKLGSSTSIASAYNTGDGVAYPGQDLCIFAFTHTSGEYAWTGFNVLQKFDDSTVEIAEDRAWQATASSYTNEPGEVTMLFAAKPDKSGWTSDSEMMSTREEELIYFTDLDILENAGYTCVAVLWEVRGCYTDWMSTANTTYSFWIHIHIKDDAIPGYVAQTVADARGWKEGNDQTFSWIDYPYSGQSGAYGYGAKLDGYVDGYVKPSSYQYDTSYTKAWYEDGVYHGHTGGYQQGNSVLIVAYNASIDVKVNDTITNESGQTVTKSVYDLDAGERTVSYVLIPSTVMVSSGSDSHSSMDYSTNLEIQVTLPVGLTYDIGSGSVDPAEIVVNSDGTTTLIFELHDIIVGETIEQITFTCTIGQAGTADDVSNGENLTISAGISGDGDSRRWTLANGNYAETTISVIRLSTSALSKSVDSTLKELGDDITYAIHYGNSSDVIQDNMAIYDILPYNDDNRGTNFNGNYEVDSIIIDFSQAQKSFIDDVSGLDAHGVDIKYTSDLNGRNNNTESLDKIFTGTDDMTWVDLFNEEIEDDDNYEVIWAGEWIEGATGFFFDIGKMEANEYLTIYITITPKDTDGNLLTDNNDRTQQPGDIYYNTVYEFADGQPTEVESNSVYSQVVERDVDGLAWFDSNIDGIRDDNEDMLSNIGVALYRTDVSSFDSSGSLVMTINGVPLYNSYDVFGNKVDSNITALKLETGEYEFTCLESGTYYVVFNNIPSGYGMTACNVGSDSTDSDAYGFINSSHTGVSLAYIPDIVLPALEDMTSYLYESEHNDIGIIEPTAEFTVQKIDNKSESLLPGAEFTLTYNDGSETLITGDDGQASTGLKVGSYTLQETKAPAGYLINQTVYSITVSLHDNGDEAWTADLSTDIEKNQDDLYVIGDDSVFDMPNAGSSGVIPWCIVGAVVLAGTTCAWFGYRRRIRQ